eukprot:1859449-Amphidinium_carterae.1
MRTQTSVAFRLALRATLANALPTLTLSCSNDNSTHEACFGGCSQRPKCAPSPAGVAGFDKRMDAPGHAGAALLVRRAAFSAPPHTRKSSPRSF